MFEYNNYLQIQFSHGITQLIGVFDGVKLTMNTENYVFGDKHKKCTIFREKYLFSNIELINVIISFYSMHFFKDSIHFYCQQQLNHYCLFHWLVFLRCLTSLTALNHVKHFYLFGFFNSSTKCWRQHEKWTLRSVHTLITSI